MNSPAAPADTTPPAGPAHRTRRGSDPYDNLEPWFEKLQALDPADPLYARLRGQIIHRCLPLTEHVARRYTGRGEDFDDLEQVARVGLVMAVDRFDVSRGHTFLSFAVPTILGEVRRHFRDRGWAVRVPRPLKELHQQIAMITPGLIQRLGRMPTGRDLAAALDVSIEDVNQALVAGNGYRTDPLDAPVEHGDSDNSMPHTAVPATVEPCYELLENAMAVRPLIAALPERERTVLILRFFERKTQSEIGRELGISQMHVSRILAATLQLLREQALEQVPVSSPPA
ncbi:SigB/SigF/SigG family RNA polymerase sigma factor [Nocardia pseudobrasiliensis]|uniref:RNA polymerase sigma-B factor n=1 Tax=Nocardia pseudobrasiliensis TaxID=45979 RepID=A0A370HWS6_9NOCA|nr:SigB/SigF/SigG family RNA polymerase sigma factor [Nocardia pseudobrasiliensis]RDI62730.1 RNA polymerase sigma-B factor [Nocardia pseudobrasiliensis]